MNDSPGRNTGLQVFHPLVFMAPGLLIRCTKIDRRDCTHLNYFNELNAKCEAHL